MAISRKALAKPSVDGLKAPIREKKRLFARHGREEGEGRARSGLSQEPSAG